MNLSMGFLLVLGMMVLIFLGPEWGLKKSGQQN